MFIMQILTGMVDWWDVFCSDIFPEAHSAEENDCQEGKWSLSAPQILPSTANIWYVVKINDFGMHFYCACFLSIITLYC